MGTSEGTNNNGPVRYGSARYKEYSPENAENISRIISLDVLDVSYHYGIELRVQEKGNTADTRTVRLTISKVIALKDDDYPNQRDWKKKDFDIYTAPLSVCIPKRSVSAIVDMVNTRLSSVDAKTVKKAFKPKDMPDVPAEALESIAAVVDTITPQMFVPFSIQQSYATQAVKQIPTKIAEMVVQGIKSGWLTKNDLEYTKPAPENTMPQK